MISRLLFFILLGFEVSAFTQFKVSKHNKVTVLNSKSPEILSVENLATVALGVLFAASPLIVIPDAAHAARSGGRSGGSYRSAPSRAPTRMAVRGQLI